MNTHPHHEQDRPNENLKAAFIRFWRTYAAREHGADTIDDIIPLFAPNITAIGSGEHEIGDSYEEVIRNFRDDFQEFKGALNIDFFGVKAKLLSPTSGIVEAQSNFELEVEPGKMLNFYIRFSSAFIMEDGKWLMAHNHLSMPSHEQEEDQAFPIDALMAKNKRLEKIVADRNRQLLEKSQQLRIEMEKTQSLLYNILPVEIAEELKEKGYADARDFDMVSILFTDFKGFTEASAKMSAQDLVAEINTCFEAFDGIVTKFGIEKIKTLGDAYMAAGGLPVPADDSVKNLVLAALEMQNFITARKAENEALGKPAFEMRAGIHTGPVVAGIVGVKKFQYDIWGDTVNTASRMESSGEVGKVNISRSTYELLTDKPEFAFENRGKIEAKGKGEVEMYFVELKGL